MNLVMKSGSAVLGAILLLSGNTALAQNETTPSSPDDRKESGREDAKGEAVAPEAEPVSEEAKAEATSPLEENGADAADDGVGSTSSDAAAPAAKQPQTTETETGELTSEAEEPSEGAGSPEGATADELDKTGTPELPPRDNEEPPEGEWKKDYDGRKDPAGADEVLIWVPRAPLYPVHLVLNYGVRWPLVAGVTKAEEIKLFTRIEDFFTFADGQAGLFPTAFYDAGRGFAAGANFFYNDLGQEGHTLRATAGYGTNNWILVNVKDSWKVFPGDRGTLEFQATFKRDPTYAFTGLGPDTEMDDQVFFSEEKIEGKVELRVALQELNRFAVSFDFRQARLGNGRDPSIEELDFDTSGLTGFEDSFFVGAVEMKLDLDSRTPVSKYVAGSGVRLESWGSYHYGPGSTRLSFFRYGMRPSLLWDITGANHVLSMSVYAEALSRVGGEDVPLNELVTLGGLEEMKAFFPGRFRGESALVHSVDYSWPLLAFADAMVFSELGTAFEGFYDDFSYKKMVLDWGVGMKTTVSPELAMWGALAFGSNRLEQWGDSFNLDSVRFVMGVTRAF